MTTEEATKILLFEKSHVGNGIIWQFNETTLLINSSPLTQYNLYEENGDCWLHTYQPVTIAEDYAITLLGENQTHYKVLLTPKFSKNRPLILEQIVSI